MFARADRARCGRVGRERLARAIWPGVSEGLEGRLLLAQAPYWGFPFAVPVTIQAEDFDNGGEGVAYHDTTAQNIGGEYRAEGVDVEPCGDVGGGYDIGYIESGEWLEYTISVPQTGYYDLELRLASGNSGGVVRVLFDGSDVTGRVDVPNTGGWQNWQTVVAPNIRLRGGEAVMRVAFEGDPFYIANFNAIRISGHHTPYWGVAASIPGTVQAEDFDHGANGVAYYDTTTGNIGGAYRATDVDIETAYDVGGGYNVGWMDVGEWLEYTVQVAESGVYDMQFRVASWYDGTTIGVRFGGEDRGTIAVPNTGGWQAWQTIQMPVLLTAGVQTMRLYAPIGGLNVNWVKLTARPGEIRGMKFGDTNGNGIPDLNFESGLANWRIELRTLGGALVGATQTAWDGSYAFLGLSPGTYVVSEQMQSGWLQTAPSSGTYTVGLGVGGVVSGLIFGNVQAAEIRGMKFHDLNLNRMRDAGEPGLGGWSITLDRDGDGTIEARATTAADGTYVFTNVLPGHYHVGEVQQTGWVRTTPEHYYNFDVQAGTTYTKVDFGNVKRGGLYGVVYDDVNDDGVRQGGESSLSGWTVMLRSSNGSLLATTETDSEGNYAFEDLDPGTYLLTEVLKEGWVHTWPTADTRTVELGSGAMLTGVDFGNTVGALITFDDLAAGTVVTTQYLGKGVEFLPDPARTKAVVTALPGGYAVSGAQVADISVASGGVEFPLPRVECRLSKTARQVSVYVGLTEPWIPIIPNVVLTAYDANHNVVGSAGPVQPDAFFGHSLLKVAVSTASIASFAVACDVNNGSPVGIDDVRVITPTATPDFSLVPGAGSVSLGPGGWNTATMNIIRLNGSAGNVQFSAAGLPPGVTASFSPNPAGGNSTMMTLTASSSAPDTEYLGKTVTITGTPASGSVGPGQRSTSLQVVVRHSFAVEVAPGTVEMALSKSIAVNLTRQLDFTGTIQLEALGLPAGVTATFTPASMTPAEFNYGAFGTSVMKLTATPGAALTDFTGTVLATSGGQSSSVSFSIHRIPGLIEGISPNQGAWAPQALEPGWLVTLKGDGFIPGSTVRFGAGEEWASATHVSSDCTELQVRVPRLATTGLVTVRTPTGREFQSAASYPIFSYRSRNGYAFENPTADGVSWQTAEMLFGHGQMHFFFDLIPDPLAAVFVAIADKVLKGGQCYGVGRTSQQFMNGYLYYGFFDPTTEFHVHGLTGPSAPSAGLYDNIHIQHTAQISAEGIAVAKNEALSHALGDGAALVKGKITAGLQAGDHPLVSMLSGSKGHTVVAYDLEDDPADPNGYYIRVYDPNRPYIAAEETSSVMHLAREQNSRIHVTGGRWYFQLDDGSSPKVWDGKMQTLVVTRYGEVPNYEPTIPSSPAGIWEMITGASASTTQVSDGSGHFLLNPDGTMNDDPATRLLGALQYGLSLEEGAIPLYLLESGGQYVQTVKGTGGGTYATQILGGGIGLNLWGVPSIAGVNDELRIDTGSGGFEFRTGAASKTFSLDLVGTSSGDIRRTVSIRGTSFAGGGDAFAFDAARQSLVFRHEGPATTVAFSFTQPDAGGDMRTFSAQPVFLEAGDTATLTPVDWSHLDTSGVALMVARSNGSQVTQTLARQLSQPTLALSSQLVKAQGEQLLVYPGGDETGVPAVYSVGEIEQIRISDGASATLEKVGGGLMSLPQVSLEGTGRLGVVEGGEMLVKVGGLNIGPSAVFDLGENDLIVTNGGAAAIGELIRSERLVGRGRAYTGLAAILNDQGDGKTRIMETFGGQGVGLTDVLVKYTWDGDSNLDGLINADDYFLIDSGYITQAKGYRNGDINYDGVVNADDYFLIDSAFIGQGGILSAWERFGDRLPVIATEGGIVVVKQAAQQRDRDSVLAGLFCMEPVI